MQLEITPLADPEILIEINNSALPYVNTLDRGRAEWLLRHAIRSWLARLEERPAGVLVLLEAGCRFESDYFRWFTERYENFLYIDRVIVADWARQRGVASELYRVVEGVAEEGGWAIATEVYSQPPNTASLNFHRSLGYQPVGEQVSLNEGKTVLKLMKFAGRAIKRE